MLLLAFGLSAEEHYIVQHYSIRDGMSQNTVMAIMQDKQGFMWFGTWDGSAWAEGCKNAVKKVRDAGIRNMIMIDCAGW